MIVLRTVCLTSEVALCILFLHFIFFSKRPSSLVFCYGDMGFKIGIMYMTYLLNFIKIVFKIKFEAQSTF